MTSKPDGDEGFAYLGVSSDVSALGTYTCQLTLGQELLRVLDREEALTYCTELTWAITCAEYDAAVLKQLKAVEGLEMVHVTMVVQGIRQDRRPVLSSPTHPVSYEPIVSHRDLQPRITAVCGDTRWQWDLDVARQHVSQVMEVAAGVDMDASYFQYLRSAVDVDMGTARNMVRLLREHMPGHTTIPE